MIKKPFISLLAALLLAIIPASGADDLAGKVKKILRQRVTPTEAVDSALSVIIGDGRPSPEDFAGVEQAMEQELLPFVGRHDELTPLKLSEVYWEYARLCSTLGAERIDDYRRLSDTALEYARQADDPYMIATINDRRGVIEERYGDSSKAFGYFAEALDNYRRDPEKGGGKAAACLNNQAMIYLRLADMDGMKRVVDNLRAYASECADSWRDYVLYYLYTVEGAYYGTLFENASGNDRKALRDSIDRAMLSAIRLIETSSHPLLSKRVNPVWNYYNRAVFFLTSFDTPVVDSVELYLDKALHPKVAQEKAVDFEVHVSVSSVRAEMWAMLGKYDKAKEALTSLLAEMDSLSGTKNIILDKIEIYKNLRGISEQSGHYDDALAFADSIQRLTSERYDGELMAAVKDSETKYRTQETQLALARSEARRAATLMWLFAAAGLLLAAGVVFVVYAGRQRRRRMQREMEFAALRADIGQRLTQQYVEGLENERRRMSAELHDGVCNDLLAIQMNIANGAPAENTARLIAGCREEVRRISHELMPPEFAYASIDEVMRYFVAKQAEANKGKISITYSSVASGSGWNDVPDAVALEVYRIVQEAVGNAVRHSGASDIEVALTLDGRNMEVTVTDNGTYKEHTRKGLGIESIRRRAASIGGSVAIDRTDSGTEVSMGVKI